MKIYWNNKYKRAKLHEDIEGDSARDWDSSEPKSHIKIGKGRIFINPPDYGIDGYELSEEDLRSLLDELQKQPQGIMKESTQTLMSKVAKSPGTGEDDTPPT